MDVVVLHDPGWGAAFEREREAIEALLGTWLVAGVEHVGSTAIPGMPAKPVLDMVAGIAQLSDAPAAGAQLAGLGYRQRPHRSDAVLFVKRIGGVDTHHLHLTESGSRLWTERLTFRDAVRADGRLAEQYAELKRQLLRANDGRQYTAADKRDFVRRVLHDAGVELDDR